MPTEATDPFGLERFTRAQERVYGKVLAELKTGRKTSHWMWFIFPQIDGLGHSSTARFYAIRNLEEARQYLADPVLGERLLECTEIVLGIDDNTIEDIFGFPDYLKFRSCMTLFSCVAEPGSVFAAALGKYCQGKHDERTLELLGS